MPRANLPPPETADRLGAGLLETPVSRIMTPGVVTIAEDAAVTEVLRAMAVHGVHAILVVERRRGTPLGWVTARSLLEWIERDHGLASARAAISEAPVMIDPGATAAEALEHLRRSACERLLVTPRDDVVPEGVVSDLDLVRLAAR
jgi:predicted transcriptional regulator